MQRLYSAERRLGKTQAFRWRNRIKIIMKIIAQKLFVCAFLLAVFVVLFNQSPDASASAVNETILLAAKPKPETRCGWFSNPTPANAWLNDKDGEWLISVQGGYQAEGDWADFAPNQWVETNVHYGYGCACMNVTTDKKTRRILTIKSAKARLLSVCRKDKKLKEPK